MKKVISMLLIFTLIVGLYGCGATSENNPSNKSSGLTISALQKICKEADDDLVFKKTHTENGYNFHYANNSSVTKIEYSGEADEQENIKAIKIVNSEVETSKLKNTAELNKILNKTSDDLTMNDLRVLYCFIGVANLREAFGADDSSLSVQEVANLFAKSGSTMSVGDWTIEAQVEGTGTVIISATYAW